MALGLGVCVCVKGGKRTMAQHIIESIYMYNTLQKGCFYQKERPYLVPARKVYTVMLALKITSTPICLHAYAQFIRKL